MNQIKVVILTIAILLLAGCAGSPFKWNDARKIQPGMTTTEVTQIMGAPNNVTSRDGVLIYVWVSVNSFTGSKTLRVDFKDNKAISAPPIPESFQD